MKYIQTENDRGATLIECSIVIPLMLAFTIITLDLLLISYQQLTLQYVFTREKRQVLLGAYADASAIRATFEDHLSGFGVDLSGGDQVTICPLAQYQQGCTDGMIVPPPPGELMFLSVTKTANTFLLGHAAYIGTRTVSLGARGIGRSEPW